MWSSVAEELVNSTAIIDHSNILKPYMEFLILLVLHVPPEKHPTEKDIIAGKLLSPVVYGHFFAILLVIDSSLMDQTYNFCFFQLKF